MQVLGSLSIYALYRGVKDQTWGLSSSTRKWYSEEWLQHAKRAAREWAQAEVGLQNGSWNQTEWDLLLISGVFIIVAQ